MFPLIYILILSRGNNKEHHNSTLHTMQGSDGVWEVIWCSAEDLKSMWKLSSIGIGWAAYHPWTGLRQGQGLAPSGGWTSSGLWL